MSKYFNKYNEEEEIEEGEEETEYCPSCGEHYRVEKKSSFTGGVLTQMEIEIMFKIKNLLRNIPYSLPPLPDTTPSASATFINTNENEK